MAITKEEFYRELEKLAKGYYDEGTTFTVSRDHAQVILQNKAAALEAAAKQSATIEKLLQTQSEDQKKVFELEQVIAKLQWQLKHAIASRDNAIAEGIRVMERRDTNKNIKIDHIQGYNQFGEKY